MKKPIIYLFIVFCFVFAVEQKKKKPDYYLLTYLLHGAESFLSS
jgi:hypothetical protein